MSYFLFIGKSLAMLSHHRGRFLLFIVFSICAALTEGAGVVMLVPILESIGNESMFSNTLVFQNVSSLFDGLEPSERLRAAAIAMFLIVIIRSILLYASQYLAASLPQRIRTKLSLRAYNALMEASFTYILGANSGEIQNTIKMLPSRISVLLTDIGLVIINMLIATVYFILMLFISWKMTLAALLFIWILSEAVKFGSHKRMREFGKRITEHANTVHQILYESLNSMSLIRISIAESMMKKKWAEANYNDLRQRLNQEKIKQAIGPIFTASSGILICILIFTASFQEEAKSTAGAIVMFMFLLFRLLSPMTALSNARASIQGNRHAIEETERFISEIESSRQIDGEKTFLGLKHNITLRQVGFRYPTGEKAAIKGVNFKISKGEMVAIVGPSGSGKSTLVALLARFFTPQEGAVLIDNIDLREIKLETWLRRIAMVSQDITLFNDSVRANIVFGNENKSEETIRQAARLAAADDFIIDLPDGYDTKLGEKGTRLSGGQRQRIALARALLCDPDILILDEATSHLDYATEAAIQSAIEKLRGTRTIIVIAHRLSTIRSADRILVMRDGQLIEQGSHAELIAKNGHYQEMLTHHQFDLIEDDNSKS